ncbi:DNA adenine methylase [Bacillus sp. Bva_UNVM-123]|uniref:DNA adenine methylase n=1 Tax=Bacillus sp. Bva_UNVM-123 TaxID=2829798 RepID=UPI00391F99F6
MAIPRILNYPGSKWSLANWIISHMPEHHTYIEPYFGSGAVFFTKTPSPIETINDIDDNIYNLFKVVREAPEELARVIECTPYSRLEYDLTFENEAPADEVEKARRFLVQCWQGHGFRTNGYKVGWKNDVQGRERAYALFNWYRLPQWVLQVQERLKMAQIEKRPGVEVIQRHNYKNVCIYADPPYLLETRTAKQYKHEMNDEDHIELLEALLQHKGPVLLSGYRNDLYDSYLKDWRKEETPALAEYGLKRKEVLWINPYAAEYGYKQQSLF